MQIKKSKLESARGKVVGIGRVKIPKMNHFDYEIPLLSFVVIQKPGKKEEYISSCIHLRIDGYGNSVNDAQIDMIDNIAYYLNENFNNDTYNKHCWANILELFEADENSNALWNQYHAFQIMLAEKGHTDRYSQSPSMLLERIKELEITVKVLEKNKIDNGEHQGIDKCNEFLDTLKNVGIMPIVEYNSKGMKVAL